MRTARLGESWKRIFAFILTFLLVLCAMPAALVNAAGEPLSPDPAAPYTDKSHVGGGPADSVEFPPYPGPGGVNIDKTAAWVDQDEGIAKVTLTINGQPKPEPVDVVLVLDVSGSMIQIEYNLCPSAAAASNGRRWAT